MDSPAPRSVQHTYGALIADVSAALSPASFPSLLIVAGFSIAATRFAATVSGVPFALLLAAAGSVWVAVAATRFIRVRRRWNRIAKTDLAGFAVVAVWLARTRRCHAPDRDKQTRLSELMISAFEADADGGELSDFTEAVCVDADRFNHEAFTEARNSKKIKMALDASKEALDVFRMKPPVPPHGHSDHSRADCPYQQAELDMVATIATSPHLCQMWAHCTPTLVCLSESMMGFAVVQACADVPADVLELAAGLATADRDRHTVFEALQLAELILASPPDHITHDSGSLAP